MTATTESKFLTAPFDDPSFVKTGLNMQYVFNLSQVPDKLLKPLKELSINKKEFNQCLLFGHGGQSLWRNMPRHYFNKAHPIDSYSRDMFKNFMDKQFPSVKYQILYPRHEPPLLHFNLQSFGQLAGWHHSSPFRVGINNTFGSWYAYRLLVLSDSDFPVTTPVDTLSPCALCEDKPCVTHCPANAIKKNDNYDWMSCFAYRKLAQSPCVDRCLARLSCPIAPQHQYTMDQIQYHYNLSRKHL